MSAGTNRRIASVESERSIARKQAIMDSATSLFRQKGFHAAGTAEIAERARLSIAQIYRDFGSKEGLILAIAARACERWCLAVEVDQAIATRDAISAHRWIVALFDRSLDDDDYGLVPELLAAATRSEEISRLMARLDADMAVRLDATLRLVAPNATDAEVNKALFLISSVIIGIATRRRAIRADGSAPFVAEARSAISDILNHLGCRTDG